MNAQSLAAGLCALALLLAGTAWAKKPQPLPPPPGGIPTCQEGLNLCSESLGACADELDICAGDLSTCTTDLAAANASLTTCTVDLGTCTGDLTSCTGNLTTCTTDLGTCEDDLAECETTPGVLPGDGAGNGAPLEYEVCADGLTVADLNTGLLWERKVAGGGGSATCLTNLHGVDSTCNWPQATGDWIDAVNAEGGTGYAGFSDWRVPNVKELQSIVDYSAVLPSIHLDFGPTAQSFYWSPTSNASNQEEFAWYVSFIFGGVNSDPKINGNHVRAVRSGSCSTP